MKDDGDLMSKYFMSAAIAIGSILALGGCDENAGGTTGAGGGGNLEFDLTGSYVNAIPSSPFSAGPAASPNALTGRLSQAQAKAETSTYEESVAALQAVLDGTDTSFVFSPDNFSDPGQSADCYGPEVAYVNHPDFTEPSGGGPTPPEGGMSDQHFGVLPTGDVGMWDEATEDGEACAAAQLNALASQGEGLVVNGLGLAAMMLYEANSASKLPAAGESSDLLTELQARFTADTDTSAEFDIDFTTVTMARSSDGLTDTYNTEMTLGFSDDGSTESVSGKVELSHTVLDEDAGTYRGILWFQMEMPSDQRFPNCDTDKVQTINATVAYEKESDGQLTLQSRNGFYCGASAVDGRNSAGVLDAAACLLPTHDAPDPGPGPDAGSNPCDGNTEGWTDNFSIYTSNFNTTTNAGTFSYAWQAGAMDDNSRVFVGLVDANDTGEIQGGRAYFGFGDQLQNLGTDVPHPEGYICNWAGPGRSHELTNILQYQSMNFNSATGVFEASSVAADNRLTYAPVNGGNYTDPGDGTVASFRYGKITRTSDGPPPMVSSESEVTALLDDAGAMAASFKNHDLFSLDDIDADTCDASVSFTSSGATPTNIWDAVVGCEQGLTLPTAP